MVAAKVQSWLKTTAIALLVMSCLVAVAQSREHSVASPANSSQAGLTVTVTIVPSISVVFDSNQEPRVSTANSVDSWNNSTGVLTHGKVQGSMRGDVETASVSPDAFAGVTYVLPSRDDGVTRILETRPLYGNQRGRRVQMGVLRRVTVVTK